MEFTYDVIQFDERLARLYMNACKIFVDRRLEFIEGEKHAQGIE